MGNTERHQTLEKTLESYKHWKAIKVKEQHLQSVHKEIICRVNFHPKVEFLL